MAAVPPGAAEQSRAVRLAHNRYPHSPGGTLPLHQRGISKIMADSSGEPSEAAKRQARREEYNPLPLTGKRAHLKPTAHRCNDRVEDVVQGIFKSKWRDNLYPQISLMFECLNSQPGQEPTAPYTHVTPTPPDDP